MPADNRKLELRSLLAGKSTEELEELLALDFAEDKKCVDAEYIATILEVIEERENRTEERNKETLDAWDEFQAYREKTTSHEVLEAGKSEEPTHEHRRIIEYRQKSRKYASKWRVIAVAAAAIVLLCGTAFALNIFQAIAEWTVETFYFLTGQEKTEVQVSDPFNHLRNSVGLYTDVHCVPHRAPAGTQESGTLNVIERDDRYSIGMGYTAGDRVFSIRIIIHHGVPEDYSGKYQKDATIQEEHVAGGITYYIVGNNNSICAMWVNGSIEGYIQGNLTIEEIRQMIDSIYEE